MQARQHHHTLEPLPTPAEIARDTFSRALGSSGAYRVTLLVLFLLFVGGVAGFAMRLSAGMEDRGPWGYYAAVFGFLFTVGQAAPMVAFVPRLARARWHGPLVRAAQVVAVAGLLNVLLFIPLLWLVPSSAVRTTVWFDWPWGAPHFFDTIFVLMLVMNGFAFLWVQAMPDLASLRVQSGGTHRLARLLSGSFIGTPKQWKVQRIALAVLGGCYVMNFIFVQSLISLDYVMTLVPGWKSSMFPAFYSINGLLAATATTIVVMAVIRRFYGLQRYITVDQFWNVAKIMLALNLAWAYHWWSDFLTTWYGRIPRETVVTIGTRSFGENTGLFVIAFISCFLLPLLILMWNPWRKSVAGPTVVASLSLFGIFIQRIIDYVPAYLSTQDPLDHELHEAIAIPWPGLPDVLIIVGGLAGAIFLVTWAVKALGPLSNWEMQEGVLLRRNEKFLNTEVPYVIKPQ